MKKFTLQLFVFALLLISTLYAQVPQRFNYQGIARDAKGNPMAGQTLSLKISLLPTADAPEAEYEEIQTVSTNAFGLYTLQIGNGAPTKGEMKAVKWESGNKYIRVAIDPKGGTDFVDAGTTQLLSVPYALYADRAGLAKSGSDRTGAVNSNAAHVAGDANYLTKFTGFNVIGKSLLFDNGTNVGLGTNTPASTASLHIQRSSSGQYLYLSNPDTIGFGSIRLYNDVPGNFATFTKYGSKMTGGFASLQTLYPYANALGFGNNGGAMLNASTGNIGFAITKGGGNKLKIHIDAASERLGLGGNAAPAAPIHINNPAGAADTLKFTNSITGHSATDGLEIRTNGNTARLINRENAGLLLGTNNNDRLTITGSGNVGIGTTAPHASAITELSSTTQGFLPPRMSTTQRNGINAPANGLIIFNTTTGCLNYHFAGAWYEWCGTFSATVGTIGSLNCASATHTGTLTAGTPANGASSNVSYTGGNGGVHGGQIVNSTGVSGLTATLLPGNFASGAGTLTYTITGTPNSAGTAGFALNIGGKTCTLTRTVSNAAVYPPGTVFCSGIPTAVVDVTNPITGRTWMDRNLGASQAASSSTDTAAYGDLYQWGRGADGHQCRNSATTTTLSSTDQPGNGSFIVSPNAPPYDWRSPQNDNLWQGVSGPNNPCPGGYRIPTEGELDAERLSWASNNSQGAFLSTLKLPTGGYRLRGSGAVVNIGVSGDVQGSTVQGIDTRHLGFDSGFAGIGTYRRGDGFAVRCIKEITGSLGSINCLGATSTGTLINGQAAVGASSAIPYTGGNGGYYPAQTINSTGVTGLTATIAQGLLANGAGTLTYSISGTPNGTGTASFAISIGGQSCTLTRTVNAAPVYPPGTVFCSGTPTLVVDVTNPVTGKTWMDRNLGASQAASSSIDNLAYGDLYQWGRGSDGHQCYGSPFTSPATYSSSDQPGNNYFIVPLVMTLAEDWRHPSNDNLWQGVNGINNPCPTGYRLPTESEFDMERQSWGSNNSSGAFSSPLKFTMAGRRNQSGNYMFIDFAGFYWSSSVYQATNTSHYLYTDTQQAYLSNLQRSYGGSVRCIKN